MLEWTDIESCSVVSSSLQPHGLYSPWKSPGQSTGVDSLSLLQGIFPTQWCNPGLLHCRLILYQLSQKGSLRGQKYKENKGNVNHKILDIGWVKNARGRFSLNGEDKCENLMSCKYVLPWHMCDYMVCDLRFFFSLKCMCVSVSLLSIYTQFEENFPIKKQMRTNKKKQTKQNKQHQKRQNKIKHWMNKERSSIQN